MYLPYAIIIHMDQHNSIYVYHPGQFSKIAIQGDRTLLWRYDSGDGQWLAMNGALEEASVTRVEKRRKYRGKERHIQNTKRKRVVRSFPFFSNRWWRTYMNDDSISRISRFGGRYPSLFQSACRIRTERLHNIITAWHTFLALEKNAAKLSEEWRWSRPKFTQLKLATAALFISLPIPVTTQISTLRTWFPLHIGNGILSLSRIKTWVNSLEVRRYRWFCLAQSCRGANGRRAILGGVVMCTSLWRNLAV